MGTEVKAPCLFRIEQLLDCPKQKGKEGNIGTEQIKDEFIRFILDAENDEKPGGLLARFLQADNAQQLYDFFQKEKYGLELDDCKGIMEVVKKKKEAASMAGKIIVKVAECARGY